jgi:hypothetical protein
LPREERRQPVTEGTPEREDVAVRILETGDPEIWEAKSTGHVGLALFGLPFLLAGLFVMTASLGLVPIEADAAPWYVVVPFGAIFVMVGLGMATGRRGIIIDRRRHRVVKWYGLLVPMMRREQLIVLCDRLEVSREVRTSDDSTQVVYPVRLEGNAQEKPVCIEEPLDYQQARATAESLARFLGLPVVDRSSGQEVVREPDRLDESLRERARRTGEEIADAVVPLQMRSTLQQESDTLQIRIPPTGVTSLHRLHLIGVLIFIGVAAFVVRPFLNVDVQDPMNYLFSGLMVAGFVLLPLIAVFSRVAGQAKRGCTVQASRSLLRVEQGKTVTEIYVDELEELEVHASPLPAGITVAPDGRVMIDKSAVRQGSQNRRFTSTGEGQMTPVGPVLSFFLSAVMKTAPGPCIMARSDRKTVRFGAGLGEEELLYIHARLKRVVTA